MRTSCTLGRYTGTLSNSYSISSHHFKCHLQQKIKKTKKLWQERSGKTVMGDYQEKHNNKGELLCKLKSLPSSLIRVSRGLDVPSSWYTEGDTQMQLSLVNTNVSFKSITSTWFSELCPYLFFCFCFFLITSSE